MSIKSEIQGFDISTKSVAVIGCGGLGSNVCVHLAGAGIGKLFICDFDTVSESNLNRQFVYRRTDIGRKKTDAMHDFLCAYAEDCEITAVDRKITDCESLDFAKNCNIIILAVDNAEVRKTVNDFCQANSIPLVNGGINGFFGTCYLYIPNLTPCLECAGCIINSAKTKSVSSSAGVIGSVSASLAERYLTGDTSLAGKLIIYDNEELTQMTVKPSPLCHCVDRR